MGSIIGRIGGGWVSDPKEKLELAIAHTLVSDFSQSTYFAGAITSLPYVIFLHQNDPIIMAGEMENTLSTYLSKFFENVTVEVEVIDDDGDTKYTLALSVVVYDDEERLDLSSILNIKSGVLMDTILESNK